MLLRIACVRCRLGSLWTDEPHSFLATVCRDLRRCEATLLDEQFCGVTLDSTNQGRHTQGSSLRREGATEPCPSGNRPPALPTEVWINKPKVALAEPNRDPEPEVVTNFASTAPHSPPRS